MDIKQDHRKQSQQQQRRKKTMKNAQNDAFTCRLFYIIMVIATLGLFYQFDNILKHETYQIPIYLSLMAISAYTIFTAGTNPGFASQIQSCSQSLEQMMPIAPTSQEKEIKNQEFLLEGVCKICNIKMRNRTKHCYRCGKCVLKYDHHCPWTGCCVGQFNHFRFVVMLFFQMSQAIYTFSIFFQSLNYYQYKDEQGIYVAEFGAFSLFAIFMFLYSIAMIGLFGFHCYLIITNSTTKQMLSRNKLKYLKNVKGNPFSKGFIENIKMAIYPAKRGNQWIISIEQSQLKERSWLQKIWSNQYYDCC